MFSAQTLVLASVWLGQGAGASGVQKGCTPGSLQREKSARVE